MKYKFVYNGIKNTETGELFKAWYSKGCHKDGDEVITIFGKNYKDLPIIEGLTIENETDIMTDYFENDRIQVYPENKFYNEVLKGWEKQEEHNKKKCIKFYNKQINKYQELAERFKEINKLKEQYLKMAQDYKIRQIEIQYNSKVD